MSRIHEALKKAQEERAAHQSSRDTSSAESAGISAPAAASPAAVLDAPEPISTVALEPVSGPLTFEKLQTACKQRQWDSADPSAAQFANNEEETAGKEVFRTLRTRLYQVRAMQPLRTVLITSALPGEGKTFVTANLAQSLKRQKERRTLLIDADLRISNLHNSLGAEPSPGLSDYLSGEKDELAVLQRGRDENLFLIPGGKSTANPTELLSNGRFEKLLERMSGLFDWILIDSPPSIPVSDARIIAKMCDGVLMVVRAGSTPFDLAQKACEGFDDRPLLGVVLNRTDLQQGYGGYYNQSYAAEANRKSLA